MISCIINAFDKSKMPSKEWCGSIQDIMKYTFVIILLEILCNSLWFFLWPTYYFNDYFLVFQWYAYFLILWSYFMSNTIALWSENITFECIEPCFIANVWPIPLNNRMYVKKLKPAVIWMKKNGIRNNTEVI
jgi:hypothetical protein